MWGVGAFGGGQGRVAIKGGGECFHRGEVVFGGERVDISSMGVARDCGVRETFGGICDSVASGSLGGFVG